MFTEPYSTTALAAFRPNARVVAALQAAISRQELRAVEGQPNILEVPEALTDIKPFYHPVPVESFGRHYLVIDTRAVVRTNRVGETVVVNESDYRGIVTRAALTHLWMSQGSASFAGLTDLPIRVFVRLFSESISRRLGLPPADYMRLAVIVAFFHYSMFNDSADEINEVEAAQVARTINRLLKIPPQFTIDMLIGAKWLKNMHDFCEMVREKIGGQRMQQLNPGLIFTMLGGIWYGQDARSTVSASLEYPPYFIALCYSAVNDRSYNRTLLGKEVQTAAARSETGPQFTRAVEQLISGAAHV